MKGILDILARAKLVELSDDERAAVKEAESGDAPPPAPPPRPAAAARPAPPPPPAAAPVPPPLPKSAPSKVADGKPFEAIFSELGVPPAPFPAEKLLRLLDGLRAMDAATRKAAVLAMDSADDNWRIQDCVADARQKVAALGTYKQRLAAHLRNVEQQGATQLARLRTEQEEAVAAIRKQIAELEQLLERRVSQSAQSAAAIQGELDAARQAVAREEKRTDAEIERLTDIPRLFSAGPEAH